MSKKHDEKVMVVAREELFADEIWNGIKSESLQKYINLISKKHKFLPRNQVETDSSWQQIIPYLVFFGNRKIFLMRRKTNHTDKRLSNMYSIGVGGHINKGDMDGKGDKGIMSWARREFEEEICYEGAYTTKFLGLLNDDSNDVGLVHLGLVMQIFGDSDEISVRDEHKSGKLVGVGEAGKYYKQMETWSRIVYDYLQGKTLMQKQSIIPFIRYQYYNGGKKHERDARSYVVNDLEIGAEWQFNKNFELVFNYTISKRRFEDFVMQNNLQSGNLLRIQAQVNF